MFENEYEFDYDRVVEDSDALYEDDFFDVIFDDDDYDSPDQQDYEYYYHNVVDELDNE